MSESSVVATDPAKPEDPDRVDPPSGWSAREWYGRTLNRVPASVPGRALELSWVLAGMAFGAAVAHVFQWSTPSTLVAALIVGVLSWIGRGLSTVLLAVVVTLGGLAAVYRTTMLVFPHAEWSLRWLGPLSLVLVLVGVLIARRVGVADWRESRVAAALVDLAAGGSSLILAVILIHRLAGTFPAAILLRAEDNDSWLATMATLHGAHGVSALTTTEVSTYGAVPVVFFSFVRSAVGGLVPGQVLNSQDAAGVLCGHMLLVVLCPVVAGLAARRTLRYGRPLLSFVAWLLPTAVLLSDAFTLSWYGFMTGMLAILLVVCAGYLACTRVVLGTPRMVVAWVAGALAIYAAGSSWVPLVPLAGVAVLGWYAAIAVRPLLSRDWSGLRLVALLGVPTVVLGYDLLSQYRDVTTAVGGTAALLFAPGEAPALGPVFEAGAFVAVLAGWFINRRKADRERPAHRSFATPLAWLAAYLVAVMLREAWVTKTPAHYGSLKVLFALVGLAMVFGVADLLTNPAIATGARDAIGAVAIAVMFVGTIGTNAPIYGSIAGHWPVPVEQLPTWATMVSQLAQGNSRVLCIALTDARDETSQNYDAYHCSRFASSLQGLDDAAAQAWRYSQIALQSPEVAVSDMKATTDRPWTIIIVGSTDRLHSPNTWFAGMLAQPGLKFVHLKT